MNCDFYIMPRQSGKTTSIIEEFLKDPYNTYVMTDNQLKINGIIRRIKSEYPEESKKITGALFRRQFKICDSYSLRGHSVNKILLDDYLLWTEKQRELLNFNMGALTKDAQIITYTTSSTLYNKKIYLSVKKLKEKGESVFELANSLNEILRKEALDLYNNLLTEPFTTIITRDVTIPVNSITDKYDLLEKVEKIGWLNISLRYQISDTLLEEFFEFIHWPYYYALNDISEDFLSNFNSALKKFKQVSRFNIKKSNVEREIFDSMKKSCNLGLLFRN